MDTNSTEKVSLANGVSSNPGLTINTNTNLPQITTEAPSIPSRSDVLTTPTIPATSATITHTPAPVSTVTITPAPVPLPVPVPVSVPSIDVPQVPPVAAAIPILTTVTNVPNFGSPPPSTADMARTPIMPLSMASHTGIGFSFTNTTPGFSYGTGGLDSMKKKRGRPRKYGPGNTLALSVTPLQASVPNVLSPSPKRGRGRPPGSGKNQQLAALGEFMLGSVGAGFTPHAITVAAGEDIASRIMSFSQQGPRGICILSANGAISNVTLRQPSISGGTVTYEGRFEILSLSGSFLLTEFGGARSRTGGLSVSLAGPDGRVVGGGVAGVLIAATPVQVVVGSFLNNFRKILPKPAKVHTHAGPPKSYTPNSTGESAPDVCMNDSADIKPSERATGENPNLNQGVGVTISGSPDAQDDDEDDDDDEDGDGEDGEGEGEGDGDED